MVFYDEDKQNLSIETDLFMLKILSITVINQPLSRENNMHIDILSLQQSLS